MPIYIPEASALCVDCGQQLDGALSLEINRLNFFRVIKASGGLVISCSQHVQAIEPTGSHQKFQIFLTDTLLGILGPVAIQTAISNFTLENQELITRFLAEQRELQNQPRKRRKHR